jgi:hypothetical protein
LPNHCSEKPLGGNERVLLEVNALATTNRIGTSMIT